MNVQVLHRICIFLANIRQYLWNKVREEPKVVFEKIIYVTVIQIPYPNAT